MRCFLAAVLAILFVGAFALDVDSAFAQGPREHAGSDASGAVSGNKPSVAQAAVTAGKLTHECATKALYNSTVGGAKDAWELAKGIGKAWWEYKKTEITCLTTPWKCHNRIHHQSQQVAAVAAEFQKGLDAIPGLWDSMKSMDPVTQAQLVCPIVVQVIAEMGVGAIITAATGGAGSAAIAGKIAIYAQRVKKFAGLANRLSRIGGSKHVLEAFAKLKASTADKFSRLPPNRAEALSKEALSACGL